MLRDRPKRVSICSNGIFAFESRHSPAFKMDFGVWDFAKLCFIRKGEGLLITADSEVRLSANDVVFIPANQSHRFADDQAEPMALIMICFYPKVLNLTPSTASGFRFFQSNLQPLTPLNTVNAHRHEAIRTIIQKVIFEQTNEREGAEALVWSGLIQMLVLLARTAREEREAGKLGSDRTKAILHTIDFIGENFTEDIQIQALASMAEMSYRRYTTLFREHTGMTVVAYVRKLRIEFAKRRLLETDNINFAALDAGFGDLSHFYRVFKSATGITPGEFMADKT